MGRRSVSKRPKGKQSEWKEPYEVLNEAKSLSITTIAGLKKAKEKLLKWTSQIRKQPYENHSEKNRALQMAPKNNKTRKKKSSDRKKPS